MAIVAILSINHGTAEECEENNLVPGDDDDSGCEPDPSETFLCKLTCGEGENCEKDDGKDGHTCGDAGVPQVVPKVDMNADKCRDLCNTSMAQPEEVNRCRFWRFGFDSDTQTCLLMSSGQCLAYAPCVSPHCETGDVGCQDNPTTDPPEPQACKGPIVYTSGAIHWFCINPDGTEIGNPYGASTETMPADTYCETTRRCADWVRDEDPLDEDMDKWRKLKIECDGNTGNWTQYLDDTGSPVGDGSPANYTEVLVGDPTEIKEHTCQGGIPPPELVVEIANLGDGAELSCETVDEDDDKEHYTIRPPNTCLLLCDFQLGMVIKGTLDKERGEYVFTADDTPITQEEVEKIKCW